MFFLLLLLLTILIVLLYFWVFKPLQYWNGKNVKQKPVSGIVRSLISGILQPQPLAESLVNIYNEFPNDRCSGTYALGTSALIVKDVELIKQITVKDFDHFTDHRPFIPKESEPLWTQNLFSLKGDKWRQMRATLSPSFTSSKMKAMFVLMSECADDFVRHFLQDDSKIIDVDMGDMIPRYTNDVIATTAFGIKCDSLRERNNEFYLMGKEAAGVFKGIRASIKITLLMLVPKVATFLNMRLFSEKVGKIFLDIISKTVKVRKEENIVRPDMIHLLMEARKGEIKDDSNNLPDAGFATVDEHFQRNEIKKDTELTDYEITAQALIFFIAGFDTVSRTMCFIAHELATNLHVQAKLQDEIDDTLADCQGKITYEALTKMKYLDMVISEGLRLWPTTMVIDRICVKPYVIKPEHADEEAVQLSKGDVLWVPIFAIHRDPQYYPDPLRFNPERFNDDNKKNINPYTYTPFGAGPRNCIGSRFALLEIKILLFRLLSKFELVPTEKTQIPLKLSKKGLVIYAENGFHLGFKRRNIA